MSIGLKTAVDYYMEENAVTDRKEALKEILLRAAENQQIQAAQRRGWSEAERENPMPNRFVK